MKVTNYGSPAEKAGVLQTYDVGISDRMEDQLMIMNVLSDTLYTDKISAVWREYGCNAVDANIEAGRGDKPIEVRLPTSTEPTAVIRDFGYGLTEEQVANIYCKLGASTKRNSNEMTGMLGIGSKAGFAYDGAFTVTSYVSGVEAIYNCFRERGVPRMAMLHTGPTKEVDGVKIAVPVKREDLSEFQRRAERVFRYFKVRPKFIGQQPQFAKRESVLDGTGWRLTVAERSYAIMGNVGYDIDVSSLPGDFPVKKKALLQGGIELFFEIGDLEIAASREGLQYKDKTVLALSRALGTAVREVADNFQKQIAGAKSLWDATRMYAEVFEKRGNYGMQTIRNSIDGSIEWQGHKLKSGGFIIQNKENLPGVFVNQYTKKNWGRSRVQMNNSPYSTHARDAVKLFINDNPTHKVQISKIKYLLEQRQDIEEVVVFTFEIPDSGKMFWKNRGLEGAPTALMSSLPKPPIIPGQSNYGNNHRPQHSARLLEFNESSSDYLHPASLYWTPTTVDKDGEGIFVPIQAFEPYSVGINSNDTLKAIIKDARALGLLKAGQRVIGLKMRTEKDTGTLVPIAKLGVKWRRFDMVLTDAIAMQFKAKPDTAQQLSDYIESTAYGAPILPAKFANKLAICKAQKLLIEYERMNNGLGMRYYCSLRNRYGKVFNAVLPDPTFELGKAEKEVIERYPLLAYGDFRSTTLATKVQPAIDYINMVETLAKISASRTSTTQTKRNVIQVV